MLETLACLKISLLQANFNFRADIRIISNGLHHCTSLQLQRYFFKLRNSIVLTGTQCQARRCLITHYGSFRQVKRTDSYRFGMISGIARIMPAPKFFSLLVYCNWNIRSGMWSSWWQSCMLPSLFPSMQHSTRQGNFSPCILI